MGKLVIILVFSLGALLMLETVQATNKCTIYVITGTAQGAKHVKLYTVVGIHTLKTEPDPKDNPGVDKVYHISGDCTAAVKAVQDELIKKTRGSAWFRVSSHKDRQRFYSIINPIIEKYSKPKELSIAMAEGDDDDYDFDNMIDGENSRLQELLLRLLD